MIVDSVLIVHFGFVGKPESDVIEKDQFEAFVTQRIMIAFRGFRAAEESAFLIGAEELRGRVKAHMTDFFASRGVCECYKILVQRSIIHDEPWLKEIPKAA